MTDDPDAIPIIAHYRGVPIHDQQSAHRVSTVVEPEIDRVHATSDHGELLAIARNIQWAPEARLFAGAKLLAEIDLAVDERRTRPAIDPKLVRACMPGLNSHSCRSETQFCSIYDVPASPGAAPREVRLEKNADQAPRRGEP